MKPFVSSYALADFAGPWDRPGEEAMLDGLARLDVAGLELPFLAGGRLHKADDGWLIEQLQRRGEWRVVLSTLPGTMAALKDDPRFGLASSHGEARRRALDFLEKARRTVEHLAGFLPGRAAAVLVHSAPRYGWNKSAPSSSADALAESLSELRSRDWSGAELLLEHCDAPAGGRPVDKGFMPLEKEIEAAARSEGRAPLRMLVNWGRSALETRSADGPCRHLRELREHELLGGLFFSGVTPEHPDYGSWKDSHAPFASSCRGSLLTRDAAQAALRAAGPVDYLGIKIQALPASLDAARRAALIQDALKALRPDT